jgi:hypothetical protein
MEEKEMRTNSDHDRAPKRPSMLIVLVDASEPSGSGRIVGSFTLPVAADWDFCGLPAGRYLFVVQAADSRSWVYVRGDEGEGTAVIFASSTERAPGAPMSELRLAYEEGAYRVHSLKLPGVAKLLTFDSRVGGPLDVKGSCFFPLPPQPR